MSFNSLDKVRSLFTLCSKLGERKRKRDRERFLSLSFSSDTGGEKKGIILWGSIVPAFFHRYSHQPEHAEHWPRTLTVWILIFRVFFFPLIINYTNRRYRYIYMYIGIVALKSKVKSWKFSSKPNLQMYSSKRAAEEGLNDRWALHFLPLSFFPLLHPHPVS